MRTQTDLEAAFVLIEASVDEHAEHAQTDRAQLASAPVQVVDLRSSRPRSTTRRSRSPWRLVAVVGGAAAAVTAAALLVVVTGLGSSGSQPSSSHAGPTGLASDGRTVPFTIAPSTGLQIIGVTSTAAGRFVELAGRTTHLTVWIGEPDRDARIAPGLEAVTIGSRRGYYNQSGPSLVPASTATSTASTAQIESVGWGPAVVWEYAPSAFATVTGVDPDSYPSSAVLLQAARGLRIGSSAPLALSFSLTGAPFGGVLTKIVSQTREVASAQPPYTFASNASLCEADYSVPATGNGVSVTVERGVLVEGDHGTQVGSGVAVVVDGHDARWDVRFHQLVVDLGDHVYALLVEQSFTGRYTLSRHQLEEVFGLVSLAPDVTDPSTWITAQRGLP